MRSVVFRANLRFQPGTAHDWLKTTDGMEILCTACGHSIAPGDQFCRVCGRAIAASGAATPAFGAPATVAVGQTIGPAETSGKAITSLVCGFLFFVPFAFIAAIVFGHMALSEIKRSAGRLKGEGLAIAGLVLGYMWVVGIPVILIIAAIAIPNLLRARMAANESSAIAGIQSLIRAEITYTVNHPDAGFTCSLSDLAGAGSISGRLANGQMNGYGFELQNCGEGVAGNDISPKTKFQVWAYPMMKNQTGIRTFCADESGVIKAIDAARSADACLEHGSLLQ
jgi:type IV pilus assembly protein PilA